MGNRKPSPCHPNSPSPICTVSSPSCPHPRFYPKDGENARTPTSVLPSPPSPPQCLAHSEGLLLPSWDRNTPKCTLLCPRSVCPLLSQSRDGGRVKERVLMLVITNVPPALMCTRSKAKPGSSPPSSGQGGIWTQCPQTLGRGDVFVASQGHHPRSVALGSFLDFPVFHFSSVSLHREYMSHHRKYFRKD